jgi:uncharacterized damage-inducible protein DinB
LQRREIPSPERSRLLARYLQQADDLERLVKAIPETELHQPAPAGGWSLHQVLAHIRDVEVRAYHMRLERILRQDDPLFEDFDAEAWMEKHYRESEPVWTVVTSFNAARQRARMLTADMKPEDWERTGTHPETGPRSFEWWMIRSIDHAQEHLDEVERRRQAVARED